MKKIALILAGSTLLLAACTQENKQDVKQNVNADMNRMSEAVHLEVQEMNRSIQEWIKPNPRLEPQPIATSSYCYHAYGDVVCYKNPMPKGDERLVGYQEPAMAASTDIPSVPPPTVTVTAVNASPMAPPYARVKPVLKKMEDKAGGKTEADAKKPLNPYAPRTLIPSAL